jgi:hypothetical protein
MKSIIYWSVLFSLCIGGNLGILLIMGRNPTIFESVLIGILVVKPAMWITSQIKD